MYFKSTPTPDFKQFIKTDGISTEQDKEIIEGVQSTYNNLIPQDAFEYIKSYLEAIPELDLSKSKNITLKIEIDETSDEVGEVLIISQNTNRTLTTIKVPTNDWPLLVIENIKPVRKFPTLGKCLNCLKFTFKQDNSLNFLGNLGGQWDGSFRNGQKVYRLNLPNYSFPFNGATTDYRIFWKPNITGTFPIFGGEILTINNKAKWIAVPSASIGTVNELSNTTFFHILSDASASCPFTPNPTSSEWNFQGDQGKFLLELANTGVTEFGVTKCPTFTPTPGTIDWGWNCGPNGCVEAPSGSTGKYATLKECQEDCIAAPTQSFSYNCTPNGCIQVPFGSGSFATLAQCQASCNPILPTECDCTGSSQNQIVPVVNPNFSLGSDSWTYSPNPPIPGVGGWIFEFNKVKALSYNTFFNAVNTSSIYLSQVNVLTVSCSYEICFQAWSTSPSATASFISVDTGNYTTNLPVVTPALTTVPTAYTASITNIQTPNLTFFVSSDRDKIYIDSICVKQTYCPPPPVPPLSLVLTGSTYCYTDVEYDCTCPDGFTSNGSGSCISSSIDPISGSIETTVPCGNCVECTHGLLYNGYVVDAGGPTYAGRGTAGIVNTNSIDNPINTWKIPENNDWYNLVTFINNSTPPSNITPTGSYGVEIGGKLKDYTRDLIATCWEFPNVGAQTEDFSSGWNGVAGGVRNNVGVFSGLKLEGYWWIANSTLSSSPLKLAAVNLKHYSNEVYRDNLFKSNGCSIRLVRPAESGETSGDLILNAYVGNDGTTYNGIVLGNQVWTTVNLSETRYNNGSFITLQPDANVWDDTLTTANKFACYYNNQSSNANLPTGNINPSTGLCYEYPKLYVYRNCSGTGFLAQTEPGSTTTPGEVQRANNLSCWEFFAEYSSSPNVIFTEYYTGNYFASSSTVYNDCEECNATHTIYMTFNTKNC